MSGYDINQLVLPKPRRLEVLQVAHDNIFSGGHFGIQENARAH